MTLRLRPEVETRLRREAERQGIAAEAYAEKLIAEHLPATEEDRQSLTRLFAEWATEDLTNDPAEIDRRNRDVEEFKRAMNENRVAMEGPQARTPFP